MDIVSTISARKCRLVFCARWVIWTARNKEVHEGIKKSSYESVVFIRESLKEIDDIERTLLAEEIMMERWRPPDPKFIKINFDVAFKNPSSSGDNQVNSLSSMLSRNKK